MKKGWEVKRVGDVCSIIAGQSPEGKYYNDKGKGLPFYQGKKEFSEKYIGAPTTWTTVITKEAMKDDVLMSVRAPVGPVNFSTQKICIGRGLAAIRPGKNIDKDYLFNFLIKHESEIVGNTGAVFNSINKSQIEDIEIPLPTLPEQKRIVAILDKAFATIDQAKANTQKNLQNAKDLFESYLQNVFANPGEDWEQKRLGDVCEIGDGNYSSKYPKASEFISSGVPFLTATNLKNGTITPDGIRFISHKHHLKLTKGHIKENDLVIVVRGSSTGNNSIVPKQYENSNLNSQLAFLRVKDNKVSNEYLFIVFNSPQVQEVLRSAISGAAQPQLPNNRLLDIKILYPDKFEQEKIVRKIKLISAETKNLEENYKQKLNDLEELKKSILQKAFAGQLTS